MQHVAPKLVQGVFYPAKYCSQEEVVIEQVQNTKIRYQLIITSDMGVTHDSS